MKKLINSQADFVTKIKSKNSPMDINNFLCFALYSTSRAMTGLYAKYLDPLELTYPQLLVLIQLWNKDGMTVTEIGSKILLDTGTLTPLLKRLEAKKLIVRERSKEDERSVFVRLTNQGKSMQTKLKKLGLDMLCDLEMNVEEVMNLAHKIQKVRRVITSKIS